MKLQIVLAALAAVMLPVHGAKLQCSGAVSDSNGNPVAESSGFLTADFTQKACAASGGSIEPNRKGNDKCCVVSNEDAFLSSCRGLKAGSQFPNGRPIPARCWGD
ncbi:hypothetical protein PHYSODRAFT_560508 [Phytophthora sojae]|uniref:Uncharacterized protein n=1 Tax=Phytophthora sojae (strain P6497) TaxID=1094619 RepID=G4ZQ36_PHYSP|nr:hypothetical protein PHYSODRAFT_560508 [Phytophthora sojae]EGZ14425.1 hypothetical protein PHYSODRAFT_560508 [Phytophthora sojae]|eukprot:XP_009528174.1 hypothetical protein PHYSODRAFT_560508 [Phytophthora sojae]